MKTPTTCVFILVGASLLLSGCYDTLVRNPERSVPFEIVIMPPAEPVTRVSLQGCLNPSVVFTDDAGNAWLGASERSPQAFAVNLAELTQPVSWRVMAPLGSYRLSFQFVAGCEFVGALEVENQFGRFVAERTVKVAVTERVSVEKDGRVALFVDRAVGEARKIQNETEFEMWLKSVTLSSVPSSYGRAGSRP